MFYRLPDKKHLKTLHLYMNQCDLIFTLLMILAWSLLSNNSRNIALNKTLTIDKLKLSSTRSIQMPLPLNPEYWEINQPNQEIFTPEELAKYTGKDGNPAYIAVNGIVYDITNNATWAAASHFGLTAGKDLTRAFNSCHADQPTILNTLKVVGKLA